MLHPLAPVQIHYATPNGALESHPTALLDGRAALPTLEFAATGFTLQRNIISNPDWTDPNWINDTHRCHIRKLAMQFSRCDEAIVYPGIVRGPKSLVDHDDHLPIQVAHSDFTDDYRPMVLNPSRAYAKFLSPLLAEAGSSYTRINAAKRILVLQFWRNTGAINADLPLAIADASSVPYSALHRETVVQYGGDTLEFETFLVKPPATPNAYRWHHFAKMQHDEVLIFRTYDSQLEETGQPYWTPHCAFVNPDPEASGQARQSLEMRALCLFDR